PCPASPAARTDCSSARATPSISKHPHAWQSEQLTYLVGSEILFFSVFQKMQAKDFAKPCLGYRLGKTAFSSFSSVRSEKAQGFLHFSYDVHNFSCVVGASW